MSKILITFLLLFTISSSVFAQTDREQIEQVCQDFIDGTVYNEPEKILGAFYPGSEMFLFNTADTLLIMSVEEYAALYDNGRRGQKNNRFGRIVTIDVAIDVAYAKLEVLIPSFGYRFYDLLILKKIEEKWLITGKATSAEPIPKTAQEAKVKPAKEVIMTGLNKPWSMTFLSEYEVLLTEKDGTLLRINLKTQEKNIITGLPTDVGRAIVIDTTQHASGTYPADAHRRTVAYNAGWFDILLDPDFSNNNYVYLSYASMNKEEAMALKVIRAKLVDDRLKEVETILFAGPYSHGLFHFGGGMVFGSDGKLYIATGERNFFEDHNPPLPFAQDVSDNRGKIFRLNPDGSAPKDNPDFGKKAVKGLYALGIRATQGMVLNKKTGQIWFSDHGTMQGDELNLLEAGANYGWPYKTTGRYRTKDYRPTIANNITFTAPVHYWEQTIAPTGLVIYQGNDLGQWADNIIMPGLSKGNLWRLEMANNEVQSAEELFIKERVRLRKAVVSPRGKLYVLTDEVDGKIIRIVDVN